MRRRRRRGLVQERIEIERADQMRRIEELEEALTTNPSAQLRLKIKLLCVKYHPDHGQTTLSSAEVARDLIELLSD